jgi:hypothetical protein
MELILDTIKDPEDRVWTTAWARQEEGVCALGDGIGAQSLLPSGWRPNWDAAEQGPTILGVHFFPYLQD